MALPGGRREPGDKSLLQTSCRETYEETGVVLPEQTLLGELDDLHPRTPVLPPIVVRPFVFGLKDRPAVRTNEEVTLHLWAPLESLSAGATTSRVEIRGRSLEVPSYVLGSYVIWGITERILKPIIDLAV
jgi:8-oxo-dGTP pyrophosphatase MutT (NUDIX family)